MQDGEWATPPVGYYESLRRGDMAGNELHLFMPMIEDNHVWCTATASSWCTAVCSVKALALSRWNSLSSIGCRHLQSQATCEYVTSYGIEQWNIAVNYTIYRMMSSSGNQQYRTWYLGKRYFLRAGAMHCSYIIECKARTVSERVWQRYMVRPQDRQPQESARASLRCLV